MSQASLDEVNRILHTSPNVKSFYQHFLALSASMSDAQLGVAWRGKSPPFQPICQIMAQDSSVAQLSITEQQHNAFLQRSAKSEKAFIVLPDDDTGTGPPILFGSIHRSQHTEVVELVLPSDQDPSRHQEIVQRLNEFCEVAAKFQEPADAIVAPHTSEHKPGSLRALTQESLDQFVHQIHASIDDKLTMANVANEIRRLLDCDRVSVLVHKRNQFQMAAISGQPSVNHRSNTVKLLTKLATRTLKTGQRFWYPGLDDTALLPPQIEQPLNMYLAEAATRTLVVTPIEDQSTETVEADAQLLGAGKASPQVIAGIVIEHCNEQLEPNQIGPAIDTATKHAGDAIRNSLNHRGLFLYPLWRLLGRSRVVTAARNLPKTAGVLAAATTMTLALCFVPADFTLPCKGALTPRVRSRVFAEVVGKVDKIVVAHGDHVTSGQQLIKLRNEDVAIELETVNAEIRQQEQQLQKNKTLRAVDRTSTQPGSTDNNVQAIEAMLRTLNRKKVILQKKADRLDVKSPIDGRVITWEVDQRLKGRPVSPGEMLLEVVSIEGDWQLELQLADRHVGHLLDAMEAEQQRSKNKQAGSPGLRVSYLLEADPSKTYFGTVREVSQVSQLTTDLQQSVRVIVDVDEADIKHLKHVRTGVSAKLHCGKRSFGYVWLHDVWEFMQSKVLFRLW